MKVRIAAVAVAAAALSLAVAGQAAARPAVPRSHPRAAKPPQLTGSQLQAGLLQAAAFGPGFTLQTTLNTGGKLLPAKVTLAVPAASCTTFEGKIYVSGFGDTAGALGSYVNPDAATEQPGAIIDGFQDVLQFTTAGAAATFFGQAHAKYIACPSFSEPDSADTSPGGGTFQISTLSVSKTAVGADQAFTVTQAIALSEKPGSTRSIDILYVVAGTNVYSMWQQSGTNDEPSPALMSSLIQKIQALYRAA